VLYWRTAAPTVFGLDSAELTTGAATLGLVHAPGYPLYLLLGHSFISLPLGGDVGYRLNLMSALFAALTTLFLYLALIRLVQHRFSALVAALLFAFSHYFWNEAIVAEVYTLNTCLVAAILYLMLLWRGRGQIAWLCVAAWLYGLSFGNHLSVMLLGPGLAVWLLAFSGRRMSWSWWGVCCALFVLGLGIYLYLPLRYLADPDLNYATWYFEVDLTTWDGFWWMVSAEMFRSLAFAFSPAELTAEFWSFLRWLTENFLGIGLLLGLGGMIYDAKRRPLLHLGLGLMFLLPSFFFINYGALDKVTMFLSVYLVWAIWIGLGVDELWRGIANLPLHPSERERTTRQSSAVLLVLLASVAWLNYSRVDMSRAWDARKRGARIFSVLPEESVFFGSWAEIPILEYLQIVEGQRPDVVLRNVNLMSARQAVSEATIASARGRAYAGGVYDRLEGGGFCPLPVTECPCYRLVTRGVIP
jgi:hypothetical protein